MENEQKLYYSGYEVIKIKLSPSDTVDCRNCVMLEWDWSCDVPYDPSDEDKWQCWKEDGSEYVFKFKEGVE
jgi:hypothetical protein